MPRTTLAGHPAHPILITIPVGLFPFSLVLDGLYWSTKNERFAHASYYSLIGGMGGAAVSAVTGLGDYLEILKGTEAKKVATLHALLNVGIVGLGIAQLVMRSSSPRRVTPAASVLSLIGNATMMVSGWYGAHLVYKYGIRVEGKDLTAGSPEIAIPPLGNPIERALDEAPLRLELPRKAA